MAQKKQKAALYAFHTRPVIGGCPGLDWHVTIMPDDKIDGFVAWDHKKHMAALDGELKKDQTFEIAAKEFGGTGNAVVTGKIAGDYVNLTINGSGTPCDGEILPVPRAAGGLEGGGGG
jgi:hypothetical protein